jgi:hypothetical protein
MMKLKVGKHISFIMTRLQNLEKFRQALMQEYVRHIPASEVVLKMKFRLRLI